MTDTMHGESEIELDPHVEALLARAREQPSHAEASDTLGVQVNALLSGERGVAAWLRTRSTRARAAAALGTLALPSWIAAFTPRPGLAVYPLGRLFLDLALWLVGMGLALGVILRPLHRPALASRTLLLGAMVGIGATFVVSLLPAAHAGHEASLMGTGDDFAERAFGCLAFGSAIAAPAFVWLWGLHRNPARGSGWAVFVAIAAACVGGLALAMHCPLVSPLHLVAGHFAMVVALCALGLVVGLR